MLEKLKLNKFAKELKGNIIPSYIPENRHGNAIVDASTNEKYKNIHAYVPSEKAVKKGVSTGDRSKIVHVQIKTGKYEDGTYYYINSRISKPYWHSSTIAPEEYQDGDKKRKLDYDLLKKKIIENITGTLNLEFKKEDLIGNIKDGIKDSQIMFLRSLEIVDDIQKDGNNHWFIPFQVSYTLSNYPKKDLITKPDKDGKRKIEIGRESPLVGKTVYEVNEAYDIFMWNMKKGVGDFEIKVGDTFEAAPKATYTGCYCAGPWTENVSEKAKEDFERFVEHLEYGIYEPIQMVIQVDGDSRTIKKGSIIVYNFETHEGEELSCGRVTNLNPVPDKNYILADGDGKSGILVRKDKVVC